MKIQLINSPLSNKYATTIRAAAFPPLNLISLATYIRKFYPTCKTEIIDGELLETSQIIQLLDGDIIGISANTLTYDNAIEIAKAAKDINAKVILGGPHVTTVGERIIKNRPFIDVAVHGDGESALLNLIKGLAYEQIPNIIYRKGEDIIRTDSRNILLNDLPFPDYSFYNTTPYSERFHSIYPQKPFRNPFAVFSSKGCYWREISKGCIFCAITHSGLRLKDPKRVWEEITWNHIEWGADFIWDASDSFTMQKDWIKEFVRLKPKDCKVHFHVYGRSTDIDEERGKLLSQLGVYEVLIGFESGNDSILENTGKGITVASSIRAAKILHEHGINVIPAIVLGLPGETKKTMEDSYNFVTELVEHYDIQEGYCSTILPLPGSRMMKMLGELRTSNIEKDSDIFDLERLRQVWLKNFTNVDYDLVLSKQKEIRSLFPLAGSLAMPSKNLSNTTEVINNESSFKAEHITAF